MCVISSAGSKDVPEETVLRFQHPLADNPEHLKEMLRLSNQGQAVRGSIVTNPLSKKQNILWQPRDKALLGSLNPPLGSVPLASVLRACQRLR